MQVIDRAGWGARQPKSRATFQGVEAIFLHHTTGVVLGADRSDDWVRNIQAMHIDKNGWADIGYSFLYDAYGTIFVGRGWNVVGAHTPGWNARAHAFAYMGDGNTPFSDAAREALRFLIGESDRLFGEKPIKGHREAKATDCPGDWIFANRASFRDGAVAPLPAPPPMPSTSPSPSAPPFPGRLMRLTRPYMRGDDIHRWQERMVERGWRSALGRPFEADGVYGPQCEWVARAFQTEKRLGVDGIVGGETWAAAWTAPVT